MWQSEHCRGGTVCDPVSANPVLLWLKVAFSQEVVL
jgi:hypothetical protein